MSKPEPPTPPNPVQTAALATGTNIGTAIANANLNMVNQVTPTGSLDYNQTGSYTYTDPATGQQHNIPRFTATQTLSPQQQAIQGQLESAQYNLAGMANAQSGRISSLLSQGMDFSGLPEGGQANAIIGNTGHARDTFSAGGNIQDQISGYGEQQTMFGDAGDITRDYGPADNFSADRQRYEDAMMARMNPQLERERSNLEQRLQDQGIRYGSPAYNRAMDDYNRQANDARFAAVGAGGQEQARMVGMAAQRAAFQNTAQAQSYGQERGRGEFANEAQERQYQQALGAGAFRNQAQAQQFTQNATQAQFHNAAQAQELARQQAIFNARGAQRNQALQEIYQQRNQPINEITALMQGSQVSNPNFVNTPGTQIPTTDIAGITNAGFNQQMQSYQQQSQNYNNLIGGILGLGAGAIMRVSDERTKDNVVPIGTVFATKTDDDERKALPFYEYSYKGDPAQTRHVGPMAQDVEKIDRRSVRNVGGVKVIDTRRTMGNILRAA